MSQVAHIRFDGGALMLPAQDPYDREVVFEEAEFCARRHGSVGMQLGRRQILVSAAPAEARKACEVCRHPVGLMSFVVDRRRLCSHCAKERTAC